MLDDGGLCEGYAIDVCLVPLWESGIRPFAVVRCPPAGKGNTFSSLNIEMIIFGWNLIPLMVKLRGVRARSEFVHLFAIKSQVTIASSDRSLKVGGWEKECCGWN